MILCAYGCGNEAKYFLKSAKKWCCSKSYNSCPIAKDKNRKSHLGENNHRFGKKNSEKTRKAISEANKGRIPWSKGKTGVYSEEALQRMRDSGGKHIKGKTWEEVYGIEKSERLKNNLSGKISKKLKGRIPWNKGISHSIETKKKISLINKGRRRSDHVRKEQGKRISGDKNPNWKGGYSSLNIPLYDEYSHKLTVDESPKRDYNDKNVLTVLCTKCKKRFTPKLSDVMERIRCLNGTQSGEHKLYCSDECKNSCPVFNKILYSSNQKIDKPYTYDQYQYFRKVVLEREDYKCEYCGEEANIVHHEKPQKTNFIFVLDPDNGIACCIKCHYKYGHSDPECSTGKLSQKIC